MTSAKMHADEERIAKVESHGLVTSQVHDELSATKCAAFHTCCLSVPLLADTICRVGDSSFEFDPKAEARLRRKIDWMIVPTVSLLYLFCFIDRANIGQYAKLDLVDERHL